MSIELTDRIKGKPELTQLAETANHTVSLTWRQTPGAQQYIIEKLNRETGAFDKIDRVPETVCTYIDENVETAHVYTYRITSKRIKKDGSLMLRRSATQNVTLTDPHQVHLVSAVHPRFGVADLTWARDDAADGYRINRRLSMIDKPLPLAYLEGQTLSFRDDTLVSGQIYFYSVQSFRKAEDDELIFSQNGNEMMIVNLDETEVLQQKKSPGKTVTFFVRVTAAIEHYVLFRAETKDGAYTEVCRSKNGLDLKLTDKAPGKWKDAYYIIRCARSFEGKEYVSDGTQPIHVKY